MEAPKELSIAEIRKYMLENGCKVTNHALVKHFKRFLTNPATQSEARILFKTYVNVLATIKNENNQKYLILRKKYLNECPSDEVAQCIISAPDSIPGSPGGASIISESGLASPFRQPPPYKPPPEVTSPKVFTIHPPLTSELNVSNVETYHELINEMHKDDQPRSDHISCEIKKKEDTNYSDASNIISEIPECHATNISRENSIENTENKENIPRFSFSSGTSGSSVYSSSGEKLSNSEFEIAENPISVKEATRKFNRLASEEEAKVISPPSKKKPEKQPIEEKIAPEVLLAHPKAKEWIVSMARACYQELAKLANEFPELVKLQDPSTGYTALHWAAKHGNEDVVKLIAGSYKADVNARTNGGYTPLHLAMQFGRENIFELLCNVYKANRDLMDWSGNKPLDYHQQRTSVSQSTYSKIKARRKHTVERDLGFLRIGSLNVRVKKTTEAFSNFLGVGTGNGNTNPPTQPIANIHHQRRHRHHHHVGTTKNHHTHPRMMNTQSNMTVLHRQPALQSNRASVPINITNTKFDKHVHKSWGSADNLPQTSCANESKSIMPPPKGLQSTTKRKKDSKRSSITSNSTDRDSMSSSTSSSNLNSGYSSMPTTPNQLRAPIGISLSEKCPIADSDSDSACGFGSNWSVGRHTTVNGHLKDSKDI